jgi:MFS family permease
MTQEERLQNLKEKSEDDFEKNITIISSGALGLSVTFLSDIVNIETSRYFGLLIASWGMLILTLVSNLLSHLYASHIMDLCQEDRGTPNEEANWRRRTRKMTRWNITNVFSLMAGIVLFVIFVLLNFQTIASDRKGKALQSEHSTEQQALHLYNLTPWLTRSDKKKIVYGKNLI